MVASKLTDSTGVLFQNFNFAGLERCGQTFKQLAIKAGAEK